MLFASLASQHAPALPVAVSTSPALDSLASVRRTKLGLVFTLISAFFGHIFGGGGHDGHVGGSGGHAEAGVDSSDMPGVSVLSPTIIASFITAFGGFGIILSQFNATKAPIISAPLSVLGGFVVAGCSPWSWSRSCWALPILPAAFRPAWAAAPAFSFASFFNCFSSSFWISACSSP